MVNLVLVKKLKGHSSSLYSLLLNYNLPQTKYSRNKKIMRQNNARMEADASFYFSTFRRNRESRAALNIIER